jgi:hypothetical protein
MRQLLQSMDGAANANQLPDLSADLSLATFTE